MTAADTLGAEAVRTALAADLEEVRRRSRSLTDPLDDGDLLRQHSAIMSPLVWDLAHVGNHEELWLLRAVAGIDPLRPEIDDLYDAFQHPRADRPRLPLLEPGPARAYIEGVRQHVLDVLDRTSLEGSPLLRDGHVYRLVVQHEHMHDETMLATLQLRRGVPVVPADRPLPPELHPSEDLPAEVLVPGGPCTLGTDTDPWAYDNERPRHRVEVDAFWLDTTPVSCAAYAAFVEDGGYTEPRWWTARGRQWLADTGAAAPATWRREGVQWLVDRFGRTEVLDPAEPVQHVSHFEAAAWAAWAGRRLPAEQEWEKAASWDPAAGRARRFPWGDDDPTPLRAGLAFAGAPLRPAPVGSYPLGAAPCGARQLVGDVWEWTSSGFRPWPGFAAFPYREYSEVFFGGDYAVLRGGSWATHPTAVRATFRNWDHPQRRQIFAGFRTARDAAPGEG